MADRQRNISVCFRVTEQERELISQKMKLAGIRSLRAYLLKMAIDGYVVNLDLRDINEMVRLLSNATNNLNQIAMRVNQTGNIFSADIEDLKSRYDELWEQTRSILHKLSAL